MRPIKKLLLAFGLVLSQQGAWAEKAGIGIQVSMPGNLVYQMDCLTGGSSCSAPAYEALWREQGWLSTRNNQLLQEFADIVQRYNTDVWVRRSDSAPSPGLLDPPFPDLGPDPSNFFQLSERVRLAAYQATDLADLRSRWMLVMAPADAARLTRIVEEVGHQFEPWWRGKPLSTVAAMKTDIKQLLDQDITAFLKGATAFYGVSNSNVLDGLTLHLMFRPEHPGSSKGRQSENHSLVEVLPGESAADRMGVVIHEMAHYLFSAAPHAWHRLRVSGAMNTRSPTASAVLGLMDEALATAVGNGAFEQLMQDPETFDAYRQRALSFYNEPLIDLAGKQMTDMTAEYLRTHRAMDAMFVSEYFKKVTAATRQQLDSLESRLKVTAVAVSDPAFETLFSSMRNVLNITSVWTNSGVEEIAGSVLARHPYLNGLVLATPSAMPELLEALGEKPAAAGSGDTVCVISRSQGPGLLYLIWVSDNLNGQLMVDKLRAAAPCQ